MSHDHYTGCSSTWNTLIPDVHMGFQGLLQVFTQMSPLGMPYSGHLLFNCPLANHSQFLFPIQFIYLPHLYQMIFVSSNFLSPPPL